MARKIKNYWSKVFLVDYLPIILLFFALAVYYSFYLFGDKNHIDKDNTPDNGNNIIGIKSTDFSGDSQTGVLEQSGFVEQGGKIFTGISAKDIFNDIEVAPKTDTDFYSSYVQNGNFASYVPASQKKMDGGYATRTNQMNDYLAKNTFNFNLPNSIRNGYLYIKLHKPSDEGIFMYWYGSNKGGFKVSGDLILTKNLLEDSKGDEFLFNLNDIPYIRYSDKVPDSYNWLNELQNGKSKFIAGFLRVYDGTNKIDQISIAWE